MKKVSLYDINGEKLEVIAQINQNGSQYNNPELILYCTPDNQVVYLYENTGADATMSELEPDDGFYFESAEAFLHEVARVWASNEDDYRMELCLWGLSEPKDFAVPEDYNHACKILEKREFFGPYSPLNYVEHTNRDILYFNNAKEAQVWIDSEQKKRYVLMHGEVGRPEYFIWKE